MQPVIIFLDGLAFGGVFLWAFEMSEIASLGVKIDSTDATRAASELDKLSAAGGRTEEAAKRAGRSWEQTVQRVVNETSALNGRFGALNRAASQLTDTICQNAVVAGGVLAGAMTSAGSAMV